jgi:hypothetical protein
MLTLTALAAVYLAAAVALAPIPGALNPAVTQATIHSTICVPSWTATIRPPATYTNRLKRRQLATMHAADQTPRPYMTGLGSAGQAGAAAR